MNFLIDIDILWNECAKLLNEIEMRYPFLFAGEWDWWSDTFFVQIKGKMLLMGFELRMIRLENLVKNTRKIFSFSTIRQ